MRKYKEDSGLEKAVIAHWRSGMQEPTYGTRLRLHEEGEDPAHDSSVLHYAVTAFEGIMAEPLHGEHGEVVGLAIPVLERNLDRFFDSIGYLRMLPSTRQEADELTSAVNEEFGEMLEAAGHRRLVRNGGKVKQEKYFTLTKDQVRQMIFEVILRGIKNGTLNPNKRIYIRPIIYRDDRTINGMRIPALGVDCTEHDVVLQISASNPPPYLEGYGRVLYPEFGLDSPHAGRKVGANYTGFQRFKTLAVQAGFTEALIYSQFRPGNPVLEGAGENFFAFYWDGRIVTPDPKKGGLLPGTKRGLLIEIAKELGIKIEEDDIFSNDLFDGSIQAALLTGTWAGATEISDIIDPYRHRKLIVPVKTLREHEKMNQCVEQYIAVTRGAYVEGEEDRIIRVVPLDKRLENLAARVRTPIHYD